MSSTETAAGASRGKNFDSMAGADPREAAGALGDLLARRGRAATSTGDLVAWARGGAAPGSNPDGDQ